MKHIVYKLIGENNLIYIGITYDKGFSNRLSCHKRKTFKGIKFTYEILHESEDRKLIEELEEKEITSQKSYLKNIGLNKTKTGKGWPNNSGFTTLGYKFSEESKLKMSKSQKLVDRSYQRGRKRSPETIEKIKKHHKGKVFYSKLSIIQIKEIKNLYESKPILDGVGEVQQNGRAMSYDQAFSKKYSLIYKVTTQCIKHIISGRSWTNV